MIPYGKQNIEKDDIESVIDVLKSNWLTTGPKVPEFEKEFIKRVIRAYAKAEGFEEILFLNDETGSFIKVPADSLEGLVGTKIKVKMKDGLPEWSYNF